MEFFRQDHMQSGQVEAHAILWVRVKNSHWGIIHSPLHWPKRAFCKTSLFYKIYSYLTPLLRIDINAVENSKLTKIFGLTLLGTGFGIKNKDFYFSPAIDLDRVNFLIYSTKNYGLLGKKKLI